MDETWRINKKSIAYDLFSTVMYESETQLNCHELLGNGEIATKLVELVSKGIDISH